MADSEKAGVDGTVTRESVDNSDAVIEAILEEASDDPKVVLIRLSLEIEKELRFLLGSAGFLQDRDYLPLRKAVETLWHEYPVLPPTVIDAIEAFWEVGNHTIHGGKGDRDAVVRAVDSGLVVLKTLHGLPMVQFVVYHPGVEVYADAAGQQVRQDVKKL
ncbi:MAG TPA: hypothetical protein VGR22_12465 [Thermomicrobiales bacterium]|nr:hypothetical protein [Thermomicrobiales bacterium]